MKNEKQKSVKEAFGAIDLKLIQEQKDKEVEAMMVHPLTKEKAHELWDIKDLETKREKFLEVIKGFSFMKNDHLIKKIKSALIASELDFLISDFILKTEESCEAKNIRTLIKLKLITIEE